MPSPGSAAILGGGLGWGTDAGRMPALPGTAFVGPGNVRRNAESLSDDGPEAHQPKCPAKHGGGVFYDEERTGLVVEFLDKTLH